MPEEIDNAQSSPLPPKAFVIDDKRIFLFAQLAWLSDMIVKSLPTGVVFSVSQIISTLGVIAAGVLDPLNPICCQLVPVISTSFPLASVHITAFAVKPVRVPPAILSLVVDSVLIELVLPAMSHESVSSADLIAPEIDPRVNICASVIREVAYVSCLATTVSIIDS